MFVLNSDEICVYQLLCNGTEILIQCFNSIPNAIDYMKNNQ